MHFIIFLIIITLYIIIIVPSLYHFTIILPCLHPTTSFYFNLHYFHYHLLLFYLILLSFCHHFAIFSSLSVSILPYFTIISIIILPSFCLILPSFYSILPSFYNPYFYYSPNMTISAFLYGTCNFFYDIIIGIENSTML